MFKSATALMVSAALVFTFQANAGKEASATAKAKASVKKSIKIEAVSDLNFGEGYTGDDALTFSADAGQGAEFAVGGEAGATFNITLPASVIMKTGDGLGADKQIVVDNFNSNPAGSGALDGAGAKALRVGARRASIANTQVSGSYEADFVVTVAY